MAQKFPTDALLAVFLLAVMRHYGRELFPVGTRGMAAQGFAAVTIIMLAWMLYAKYAKSVWAALMLWWVTFEETQVAICTAAYINKPWEVQPGQSLCSALVGLDIGAIGICFVAALVLYAIPVRPDRLQNSDGTRK